MFGKRRNLTPQDVEDIRSTRERLDAFEARTKELEAMTPRQQVETLLAESGIPLMLDRLNGRTFIFTTTDRLIFSGQLCGVRVRGTTLCLRTTTTFIRPNDYYIRWQGEQWVVIGDEVLHVAGTLQML